MNVCRAKEEDPVDTVCRARNVRKLSYYVWCAALVCFSELLHLLLENRELPQGEDVGLLRGQTHEGVARYCTTWA